MTVVRILFLTFLLVAGVMDVASAQMPPASSQRKPNIIFIMSDDHGYQAISAYSKKLIQTPNIDRIGREGAVMRNAFVTNSVCSPSRAVILTGKYSHLNGQRDNGTYFDGRQQTLPKILQSNGYHTALVGKWHLFSQPTGFDYWNILPDQGHYYNPSFITMGKDTAYAGYVTDVTTDLALGWIEQNRDQPFFVMLHHKAPHRNWMPPQHYLQEYNDRQFALPHDFYDDYAGRVALQRQQISMKEGLDVRYDSKVPCDTCAIADVNHWAPAEFQREMDEADPAFVRGYVKASAPAGNELGMLAALIGDPSLLVAVRKQYGIWQDRVEREGRDPVDATVARLAADGLWLAELLGMGPPTGVLRDQVLERLLDLAEPVD